jgi:GntR family transcriptional regulator
MDRSAPKGQPVAAPPHRAPNDALTTGLPTTQPLYKEVKLRLTRGLVEGEWKSGEAIPSETRLAGRFAVSIGTIRKAIDELVAEQILVRQQGRGTFVATHTEDRTAFYFFHIAGKEGPRELPAHELLAFRRAKADLEAERALGLERGARVCVMRNVLTLSGTPVVLDDITIPVERFPGLDEAALSGRDGTIYGLYEARYRINVVRISERLSAVPAEADVAEILGVKARTPVLFIRRIAYTYHDSPVELRKSWVNTEAHEYVSDLWKGAPR